MKPAAFGRLCVETKPIRRYCLPRNPAAFGRLCVETTANLCVSDGEKTSRLRAAVC